MKTMKYRRIGSAGKYKYFFLYPTAVAVVEIRKGDRFWKIKSIRIETATSAIKVSRDAWPTSSRNGAHRHLSGAVHHARRFCDELVAGPDDMVHLVLVDPANPSNRHRI